MRKIYIHFVLLILCNCLTFNSDGQIIPKEGAVLNYRLVGFTIPDESDGHNNTIEVAKGTYGSLKEFNSHKILTENLSTNKVILRLPFFGQDYTWQVSYTNHRGKKKVTPFYHFRVDAIPIVDTTKQRLRIITPATANSEMLVLLDSRVMYDMQGEPLWYVPNIPGILESTTIIRDLKPTAFGTFTFLKDDHAYEIDYNGNLLWEAPHGVLQADSLENYHHEFTRLSNGNYMVTCQERSNIIDSTTTNPVVYGTLVEFDSSKKIVWYWKSTDYFLNAEEYKPQGRYSVNPHLNSFYFDEKRKLVYLGFRNTSNILKIEYPSGKVLANYDGRKGSVFKDQHSCRVNKHGQIYLFSNNISRDRPPMESVSYIMLLSEPENEKGNIKKVWEFPCNIDAETFPASLAGGGVYELPDGSFLTCMGIAGRVFIVSPDKKVTWNALPETVINDIWQTTHQYRASYIDNPEALKKFIFRQ